MLEHGRLRLRRSQRLGSADVQTALSRGRSVRARFFRLYYFPNQLSVARLALIVSKRLAKRAVDRTRIRRLARETFRRSQHRWAGQDCVIRLTAPHDRMLSALDYAADLEGLWRKR